MLNLLPFDTTQEYIGRVVFVDKNGDFIFQYQYNKYEFCAIKEGMIIYPNTVIKKCEPDENGTFMVEFVGAERY